MANVALELQKLANSAQVQIQKLSNEATEKTFKYNTQEASAARQWQTEMSNTSHQREVADLRAAGLNPILSSGGSGAQSYTTSSASAAAENASQAYSSIASSRLSGVAGIEQSRISAAATRAAAAQQAAATRAAAAAQASAARYAASMNYLTSKERNQTNLQINKDAWAAKKDIEFNKPANNPWSLADKYLMKTGISNGIVKTVVNGISNMKSSFFNAPKNGTTITKDNFSLDKQGIAFCNRQLNRLNVANTAYNRNLLVKAYKFGDRNANLQLARLVAANQKKQRQKVELKYNQLKQKNAYTPLRVYRPR